jgi:hypothetical protein
MRRPRPPRGYRAIGKKIPTNLSQLLTCTVTSKGTADFRINEDENSNFAAEELALFTTNPF